MRYANFLAAVDIIMQPPVSLKCQYMRRELLLSKFARVTSENMRVDVQSSKMTIMQAIPSVRSIFQITNSKARGYASNTYFVLRLPVSCIDFSALRTGWC